MPNAVDEVARRHAEALEGVIYGTWYANNVAQVLFKTAFDSFVLRRGLIYVWWDPGAKLVRFKNVHARPLLPRVRRRGGLARHLRVAALDRAAQEGVPRPRRRHQARQRDGLRRDPRGRSTRGSRRPDQTTIIDVFDMDGNTTRVMGEAVTNRALKYPFKSDPVLGVPVLPAGRDGGAAQRHRPVGRVEPVSRPIDQPEGRHHRPVLESDDPGLPEWSDAGRHPSRGRGAGRGHPDPP